MKTPLLLLASLILGQAASASELSCTVTKTNKNNDRDVATHSVAIPFDASFRRGPMISEGAVESYLLPAGADLYYRFEILDRRALQTQLSLETRQRNTQRLIVADQQTGSVTGAPASVINKFDIANSPYQIEVSCDVQN